AAGPTPGRLTTAAISPALRVESPSGAAAGEDQSRAGAHREEDPDPTRDVRPTDSRERRHEARVTKNPRAVGAAGGRLTNHHLWEGADDEQTRRYHPRRLRCRPAAVRRRHHAPVAKGRRRHRQDGRAADSGEGQVGGLLDAAVYG